LYGRWRQEIKEGDRLAVGYPIATAVAAVRKDRLRLCACRRRRGPPPATLDTMSQRLRMAIFLLVGVAGVSGASAQDSAPERQTAFTPRLLTLREGQAIVNAARGRNQIPIRTPDCSHLVHDVYTVAGYLYPYADSFDLYAGIDGFVRVTNPQPGDLIVWLGHAGIVVDPAEHSFYSSVSTGLHTEFYNAPAWRARGPARFYRYEPATPGNLPPGNERLARMTKPTPRATTAPLANDSYETASESAPPVTQSPGFRRTVTGNLEDPGRSTFQIPSSILVATSNDKPTRAEIAEAVSELNNGTGEVLRGQNLSQLRRKIIIYDNLSIDRAEFEGKRGAAQMAIRSRVILLGESIEQKPSHEKFRWELLRVGGGWEVLVPRDRIYVSRDVAVRLLAQRLALLAQDSAVSGSDSSLHQQAQIVRVLSALYEPSL
jgi:hypothetical protein